MKYDPDLHHRRSIRLQGYDYAQSRFCFVTICAKHHQCLFVEIMDGKARLSESGKIVQTVWEELPEHYSHVELDEWVVMPNHVHAIIELPGKIDDGGGTIRDAGGRFDFNDYPLISSPPCPNMKDAFFYIFFSDYKVLLLFVSQFFMA